MKEGQIISKWLWNHKNPRQKLLEAFSILWPPPSLWVSFVLPCLLGSWKDMCGVLHFHSAGCGVYSGRIEDRMLVLTISHISDWQPVFFPNTLNVTKCAMATSTTLRIRSIADKLDPDDVFVWSRVLQIFITQIVMLKSTMTVSSKCSSGQERDRP